SKAISDRSYAGLYWTLLTVGTTFMVLLVVGVVLYLVLSVKAINLSRRQSNFIDSVTHELKSPIASMKLYLQTLNLRQVSHEQQADFYRYMLEDVHRLDHLINQVLDAGRLETGRRNGEVEDVALEGLLRECAAAICLRYRVPSDTVRLDLQPCTVRASRVDLEMIFRNLLDNAVKYAGSQPEVEVTLESQANGRTLTRIGDNGRGIPHKLRRKIFGRFVRLGLELEREKAGTGLGLYIVRTLVKRLGGHVRVHGREAGPGTVFEIQLPGSRAEETEREAENV
ncbi:MAG: sensor histidine kinase, partial [Planctomycetota bacterium]